MKLPFSKHKQPQPIIADPHCADTIAMPVPATTVIATVKPVAPVQVCNYCGNELQHTRNRFVNGDLYLRRLPFNYLCDPCWSQRKAARNKHNIANCDTVLEPAVKKTKLTGGFVKPGIAIVGEPGPEIVVIPREAVVVPNKPQAEKPTFKVFLDGRELA